MFAARLVALLALFAVSRAQSQCGSDTYGRRAREVRLEDVLLSPNVRDWTLTVPSNVCDPNEHQVGTAVLVCDYDSPPVVKLTSLLTANVHRTGNLANYARVSTVVHCSTSPNDVVPNDVNVPMVVVTPVKSSVVTSVVDSVPPMVGMKPMVG